MYRNIVHLHVTSICIKETYKHQDNKGEVLVLPKRGPLLPSCRFDVAVLNPNFTSDH